MTQIMNSCLSRVHDAMEKAFEAAKPSTSSSKPCTSATPSTSGAKRKADETSAGGPSAPKKGLWIGDGLTESDLEDSSDEEDGEGTKDAEKVEEKGLSKPVAV